MARKKKVEASEEKLVANFSNGDKTAFINGRLIRNGETVTAEELDALRKLGVVDGE